MARIAILPRAWIFVSCVCCVSVGSDLYDDLVTRSEESCRMRVRLILCELETSKEVASARFGL